eukprot:jgi/Chlat1/7345/Chrsp59S06953
MDKVQILDGFYNSAALAPKPLCHGFSEGAASLYYAFGFEIMRNGTECAYSAATFNDDGTALATVGSYPDYWLTVWRWEEESIVLRSKAFSQDVFKVAFSSFFPGQLISCGTGHIRFWKMASTFTGLKLQGDIGKFGNVELSDIAAFAELPDGKVVSGTESGDLLVWEGGLIKCMLRRSGGQLGCHVGTVNSVFLDRETRRLITAGTDGFVRLWDFEAIDGAEGADEKSLRELTPIEEVLCGEGVKVSFCFVQYVNTHMRGRTCEAAVALWRPLDGPGRGRLAAGADGTVRLIGYRERRALLVRRFNSGATAVAWMPSTVDPDLRTLVVGFSDGSLRLLLRCSDSLKLTHVSRPHKSTVSAVAASPNGRFLATASRDGTAWFFDLRENNAPIGFVRLSSGATCMQWSLDSKRLLVGCVGGEVVELGQPGLVDSSKTFEITVSVRKFETFKLPKPPTPATQTSEPTANQQQDEQGASSQQDEQQQKPQESQQEGEGEKGEDQQPAGEDAGANEGESGETQEGEGGSSAADSEGRKSGEEKKEAAREVEVEDKGPWPVRHIMYKAGSSDTFLLALEGTAKGRVYECTFEEGVIATHATHAAAAVSCMRYSHSGRFVVSGADDGSLRVQNARLYGDDPQPYYWQENDSRPPRERLPRSSFDVDPGLRLMMEQESSSRLDAARKELQWESAKKTLALHKLRRFFLDEVEVERVVVHALNSEKSSSSGSDVSVASFRTMKLGSELERAMREAYEEMMLQQNVDGGGAAQKDNNSKAEGEEHGRSESRANDTPEGNEDGEVREGTGDDNEGGEAPPALTKQEMRRAARKKREQEWADFNETKPDETYEDPDDAAAIEWAKNNKGDFKLKTVSTRVTHSLPRTPPTHTISQDPDYIVPESRRVNASSKRREMLGVEWGAHAVRRTYNEKLMALRELKRRVVEQIGRDNGRLRDINGMLGVEEQLFVPAVHADEYPENREIITSEELSAFDQKQRQAAKEAKAGKNSGLGGFGFGASAAPTSSPDDPADTTTTSTSTSSTATTTTSSSRPTRPPPTGQTPTPDSHPPDTSSNNNNNNNTNNKVPLSDLEAAEAEAERRRLRHEKARLFGRIEAAVRGFDAAVVELRRERLSVAADVAHARLRLLTMHQELSVLRDCEKQDVSLRQRMESKLDEKRDLLAKVAECNDRLDLKRTEVDRLNDKKKQIVNDFDALVEEGNPLRDALVKAFQRRVKRSKRRGGGGGEGGGSEEDESEEEDEDGDGEDDDEDEEDDEEDVCPAGCEQGMYEKVCDLREKRADQDDVLADFNKQIDAFKKEKEVLAKKQKAIEASQKIEYLEDGNLPQNLSEGLVFSNDALRRLKERIRELGAEKAALRRQQRELRREHQTLLRDKRDKEARIAELEGRAYDVQMLKFGQVGAELGTCMHVCICARTSH